MAVYPGDEGAPIPFLKIYGDVAVAPAPTVHVGENVYLYVEVINMGTAHSDDGDTLTGSLVFDHTVIHQESVSIPRVEPDGGMFKHAFRFEGHYVVVEGEWQLGAMITRANTIGEVQDDQRVNFTVSPRE